MPTRPALPRLLKPPVVCATISLAFLVAVSVELFMPGAATANPALRGYANYAAYAAQVKALEGHDLVQVTSLAKTAGGRDVYLLTISKPPVDGAQRPAILITGNVFAPHVAGSEYAMRMAQKIVAGSKQPAIAELLSQYTLYIIPRPSPDATEKNFAAPFYEQAGNARKTDDDRDFETGEDPPEDLNKDGWITTLRVRDDTGPWITHPEDPRVMIRADRKKNEIGKYHLYTEGVDNDGDESLNEDPAGGVDFNRNFPFKYGYFTAGAGPNQVSEPETRAVADFAFDHAEIAYVLTFTPEDNLFHAWKPNAQAEKNRIKTTLLGDDAQYQNALAAAYKKTHGGKDAPGSPDARGAFSTWAYFHYGRWSLAARGWWIPQVKADEKPKDNRAAGERNHLRWLDQQKIDGFVAWKKIDHPDFPGKQVEVGGFKPFYALNPPAAGLDKVAEKHVKFLQQLPAMRPQITWTNVQAKALGGGLWQIEATLMNRGRMPTMPKMGAVNGEAWPLICRLDLPAGVKWLKGQRQANVKPLAGAGGMQKFNWLIRFTAKQPDSVKLSAGSPTMPEAATTIQLAPASR